MPALPLLPLCLVPATLGFASHTADRKLHVPFTSRKNPDIGGLIGIRFAYCSLRSQLPDFAQLMDFEMDGSCWGSRGWTFQEMMLSDRLLLLTPGEVYFGNLDTLTQYQTSRQTLRDRFTFRHAPHLYNWRSVIGEFSFRKGCSYRDDVFPAISGLAELVARNRGLVDTDYVARLWRRSLFVGITWFQVDVHFFKPTSLDKLLGILEQPDGHIAPSWTWCLQGRVWFVEHRLSTISRCRGCKMQASVTLKGSYIFGQLKAATIRLTTRILNLNAEVEHLSTPLKTMCLDLGMWKYMEAQS